MRVLFVIAFLLTFAFNSYSVNVNINSKNFSYSIASESVEKDSILNNLINLSLAHYYLVQIQKERIGEYNDEYDITNELKLPLDSIKIVKYSIDILKRMRMEKNISTSLIRLSSDKKELFKNINSVLDKYSVKYKVELFNKLNEVIHELYSLNFPSSKNEILQEIRLKTDSLKTLSNQLLIDKQFIINIDKFLELEKRIMLFYYSTFYYLGIKFNALDDFNIKNENSGIADNFFNEKQEEKEKYFSNRILNFANIQYRNDRIRKNSNSLKGNTSQSFLIRKENLALNIKILDLQINLYNYSTQDSISNLINRGREIQWEIGKIKDEEDAFNSAKGIVEVIMENSIASLQLASSNLNNQIKKVENDYFERKKFSGYDNFIFDFDSFENRILQLEANRKENTFICTGVQKKLIGRNPKYQNILKNIIIKMDYRHMRGTLNPTFTTKYSQNLTLKYENIFLLKQLTEDSITIILDLHIKTALLLDISVNMLKTIIEIDSAGINQSKAFTYTDLLKDLKMIIRNNEIAQANNKFEVNSKNSKPKRLAYTSFDNRPVTDTYNIPQINLPSKTFSENYVKLSEEYIKQIIKNLSLSNKDASYKIYDTNPFQVKFYKIKGFVTPKYWESVWIVSQQGDFVNNQENSNNKSMSIYNTIEGNYLKTLTLYPPNESEFNVAPNIKNDFPDDARRVLNLYKEYIIKNIKK